LRDTAASRALVRETRLSPRQLVAPIFLVPGQGRREPIPSMAGHERMSPDLAVEYARRLAGLRVGGLLLFGRPDAKDDPGDGAAGAMMDGQVVALRAGLDEAGHGDTAIMAYASKHASFLYGPFREAAGSTPAFGDRRSYQMDPANGREALREMDLDAGEGADFLMVKPAVTSLDLLARARDRFDLPLAAYQVSGEAAMIEAAAERGWVNRRGAVLESLTAIVRAGAGIVITYFAADAASWLRKAR